MRLVALVLFLASAAFAQVPVPKASLIPVTATSVPFATSTKNIEPLDLEKAGYVEEEFLISGTANVYDWAADGSLNVKTANAPYTTRILLRRPKNPSKFSGTVVVEIPNTARRFDWYMMWGYSHEYFMEHGDAYVGVTLAGGLEALKTFDDGRYGKLSMANPTPGAVCPDAAKGKGGTSNLEEGLRWDVLSQVAAALKSNATGEPMAGFKVERTFMTTQSGELITYINGIHDHAKLANGKSAYDGYLVRNPSAPSRISQCATAPGANDPRRTIKNVDVPVVSVAAQGEVSDNRAMRKDDSDDPAGRYRLYEIAGIAHIDHWAYAGFPSWEEQAKAVGGAQGTPDWPFNAKCDPEIPLSRQPLLRYAFNGAFHNLDEWVRKGIAPPKASRLETADNKLVLDEFGNAKGGVRSPWVDAPIFLTATTTPGPATCRELGHITRLEDAKLTSLYKSEKNYASKVNEATDRVVKEKYFSEADGKKMKTELTKTAPSIGK